MRLAFFASHGGSAMKTIVQACQNEVLSAEPALAFSNNKNSEALKYAKENGLRSIYINSKTHPDPDDMYHAIAEELRSHSISHIIFSGYMRLLDSRIVQEYHNRILNIHPALLPKYGGKGMYGIHVHEAVLKAGESKSGATVHLVNENYDEGPVVGQIEVPVFANETPEDLRARVASAEQELFIRVLKQIEEDKIDLNQFLNN